MANRIHTLLDGTQDNYAVGIRPYDEWEDGPSLLVVFDHENDEVIASTEMTPEKAEHLAAELVAWAADKRAKR